MPSVTAAMNATPVDRPSRPSIQLMLLIIPTIQKIVSPAATGPVVNRIGPPPSGIGDEIDADPQRDGSAGERHLAEQLVARTQIEQVVDGAEPGRDRPAEEQRRNLRWCETEWNGHEMRRSD